VEQDTKRTPVPAAPCGAAWRSQTDPEDRDFYLEVLSASLHERPAWLDAWVAAEPRVGLPRLFRAWHTVAPAHRSTQEGRESDGARDTTLRAAEQLWRKLTRCPHTHVAWSCARCERIERRSCVSGEAVYTGNAWLCDGETGTIARGTACQTLPARRAKASDRPIPYASMMLPGQTFADGFRQAGCCDNGCADSVEGEDVPVAGARPNAYA
jgi:hypothetical protein